MEIEIGVVGKSNRWVLNQSRIRIGRDAGCEVSLPAWQFPGVAGEHLVLDVVNSAVRISSAGGAGCETYLNDRPAAPGAVVRSGDVLRLGAAGPELRIRLTERDVHSPADDYEPTRIVHEATRVLSGPGETVISPAPGMATPPRWQEHETVVAPAPGRFDLPQPSAAAPRRLDSPAHVGGASAGYRQVPSPHASPNASKDPHPPSVPPGTTKPASTQTAAAQPGGPELRGLNNQLKFLRYILLANLAVMLVLFAWVFQLNRQLAQNRDELREMRMQAQTAVGQFTPALDARLGKFDQRMDAVDARMQAAEEHLVTRMNTEIPAMLDRYINRKMAESKLKP